MSTFDYGAFSDVATKFGSLAIDLWDFLNTEQATAVMKAATKLKKPALEPLQDDLRARFGPEIAEDRVKQMTGRMCKQIMESQGCEIDKKGVQILTGTLFSTATRYRFTTEGAIIVTGENKGENR